MAAASLGCATGEPALWAPVKRDDLILGAEVTGVLRAVDATPVKPPPIPDRWDFKIAHLAEEGAEVKAGEVVVVFDPSDMMQALEQLRNEADAAEKELAKQLRVARMSRKDEKLRESEAEAALRRAELKADRPEDLAAVLDLKVAELDLRVARMELAHVRARAAEARRQDQATIASLEEKVAYYQARVRATEQGIAQTTVGAPRDGTVLYVPGWRGDKKKVGDSAWRTETVLEVVALDEMIAKGDVDEIDASRIRIGQRVSLRVDAHPDSELIGEVAAIASSVQQQSFQNPSRVVRLDLALEDTGGLLLRPGMRFRGRIETGRVEGAVLVPAEAVFVAAGGPVAYRRAGSGYERVTLSIGARNHAYIEVLGGLGPGDEVAREDPERRRP